MTENKKRFTLVKCYNEQWGVVDRSLEGINQLVLITSNKSGTGYLVNELNKLSNENEQLKQTLQTRHIVNKQYEELQQLKKDLIDHSALIKMLEDYKALNIEEIIWNLAGFESNEDFDKEFKKYLEDAKKRWE